MKFKEIIDILLEAYIKLGQCGQSVTAHKVFDVIEYLNPGQKQVPPEVSK